MSSTAVQEALSRNPETHMCGLEVARRPARSPHAGRDQVKILEIQSSPRGESSDSITLTKSFIEACKSENTSIIVDMLNVWHERLPEFDYEAIGAKYKAVKHQAMTEPESSVWERIQSLIQRFQNADRALTPGSGHGICGYAASGSVVGVRVLS